MHQSITCTLLDLCVPFHSFKSILGFGRVQNFREILLVSNGINKGFLCQLVISSPYANKREGFHPRHKDHAIASVFLGVPGEYLGCQRGPEVHGRAE